MNNIAIIGGGLAGLTIAILLNRNGFEVTVIEKKTYPFHRVCGEYVSNEVIPFLKTIDIHIEDLAPSQISRVAVSSVSGKLFSAKLDLGGFGISRYELDNFLYKKASAAGVTFILGEKAVSVQFIENAFEVLLSDNRNLKTGLVIAAYGKRSNLDQKLNRSFFYKRSPYVGVKYHIKTDFPSDLIQLDNFNGGYCGTVKIEDDKYCLCYLSENRQLKKHGSIANLEKNVLFENPHLKEIFTTSEFLYAKPEVINEISFERKSLVEDHILFCGDSAGMITPLCGNGMAIAIHSAKLLANAISSYPDFSIFKQRNRLEKAWEGSWKREFAFRLKAGRFIQGFFGSSKLSNMAISLLNSSPSIGNFLIKKTHGDVF